MKAKMKKNSRVDVLSMLPMVRRTPGFVAFARIIDLRARGGRSLDAMRMLVDVGAAVKLAFEIVDRWGCVAAQLDGDPRINQLQITRFEIDACRLACYIDNLRSYDWPTLMARALRAVASQQKPLPAEAKCPDFFPCSIQGEPGSSS